MINRKSTHYTQFFSILLFTLIGLFFCNIQAVLSQNGQPGNKKIISKNEIFSDSKASSRKRESLHNATTKYTIPTIDLEKGIQATVNSIPKEFIKNIDYVALENRNECDMNNIKKVIITKKFILICNYPGLYQFNTKGEFIRKIGKQGNGKNDYKDVQDFVADTINKTIIVLDENARKLLYFSFEGKFIKSNDTIPEYSDGIEMCESQRLLIHIANPKGNSKYRYVFINNIGQVINTITNPISFKPKRKIVDLFDKEGYTYQLNGILHVMDILCDTIYAVNKNYSLTPKYLLHSGKYKFSPDYRFNYFDLFDSKNIYALPGSIFESSNYIMIKVDIGLNARYIFYNKLTKKVVSVVSNEGLKNNFDGGGNIKPKTQFENTIYQVIEKKTINTNLKEYNYSADKKAKLNELMKSTNSKYILMKIYI